jgi:hypothetical protein
VDAAAQRERAPPQGLAHPCGKSIDLPYFGAHRPQIAAASQRCCQNDEIVVVTQFCLQLFELGNERIGAGQQRPCQSQLIPQRLQLLSPAVERRRLPRHAGPSHRVAAPAIRRGDDRHHPGRLD